VQKISSTPLSDDRILRGGKAKSYDVERRLVRTIQASPRYRFKMDVDIDMKELCLFVWNVNRETKGVSQELLSFSCTGKEEAKIFSSDL
jgi:hypothetical protein